MEGGLDIYHILLQSGIVVKSVLVLLIFCSVLSWTIILNKRKKFKEIEQSNNDFKAYFNTELEFEKIANELDKYNSSTLGLMFKNGQSELQKIEECLTINEKNNSLKLYFEKHGIEAIERSLKKGANEATFILDRRLSTLASIGSISPFIGLFGTVWGIIDSFAGLASGGGSIEAVAPGIAEALVATAVGLAAAIPAVWGYNIFSNKIAKAHSDMDSFGQDFLNLVERNIYMAKES